jgi:hypothetical protein
LQNPKDAAAKLDEPRAIQLADQDQLDAGFCQAADDAIRGDKQVIGEWLLGWVKNTVQISFGRVTAAAGVEEIVVFRGEFG